VVQSPTRTVKNSSDPKGERDDLKEDLEGGGKETRVAPFLLNDQHQPIAKIHFLKKGKPKLIPLGRRGRGSRATSARGRGRKLFCHVTGGPEGVAQFSQETPCASKNAGVNGRKDTEKFTKKRNKNHVKQKRGTKS